MSKFVLNDRQALQSPCQEISDPVEIQKVITLLEEELKHHLAGIGLAANQIGQKARISIIRYHGHNLNLINPKILFFDKKFIQNHESCLSFPDQFVDTVRFRTILLKNQDKVQRYQYPLSVIIQHEVDHLDGITIFDRKI